jgi:hypothetical protein
MSYDGFLCWGEEVNGLLPLTIFVILFFVVGGGGIYGYVVVMGPTKYHSSQIFRQRFRFVLARWHPTWYWWGALQVARNLAMCLVPVVTSEGVVQLTLLFAIYTPMYFITLNIWPWRAALANVNDAILSAVLVFVVFLSCFFVIEAKESTRNALGWIIIFGLVVALAIVGSITVEMLAVVLIGKGFFLKKTGPNASVVREFVDTMSKWSLLSQAGPDHLQQDAERFLRQLPEVDLMRLQWNLNLFQTGLFAEKPSKRISGISPVAPRADCERIKEMKRISERSPGGTAIPAPKPEASTEAAAPDKETWC